MCIKSKPKITGPASNARAEDGSRRIHWPSYWGLCVGHWLSLAYGPMDPLADPLDPWIQPSLDLYLLFLGKLAVKLLWSPPLSITHTYVFSAVLIFFVWLELMISSFPPIGSSTERWFLRMELLVPPDHWTHEGCEDANRIHGNMLFVHHIVFTGYPTSITIGASRVLILL